jgi:hypothetical protein
MLLLRDALAGKSTVTHFAEKAWADGLAAKTAIAVFGRCYNVVLLRDPRDTVCSYMGFWKIDCQTAVSRLRPQMIKLADLVESLDRTVIPIRYENLIRDNRAATLEELFSALNLEPLSALGQQYPVPETHLTSRDVVSSVDRWKTDLSVEDTKFCNRQFDEILGRLGYEV